MITDKTRKAEDLFSAFSLTINSFDNVSEADLIKKVREKLKIILSKEHKDSFVKQEIDYREKSDGTFRLNFACPYCGDSKKDERKKRGNIFIPGFNFHCFNCRTHTDLVTFLKDFKLEIEPGYKVFLHTENEKIKTDLKSNTKYLDFSYVMDFNMLENFALSRDAIMKHFKLSEITDNGNLWIKKYLQNRGQSEFKFFANDKKLSRLFIFNLTPLGKVLGLQVRNFKSEPKYVTHTLEMLHNELSIEIDNPSPQFKEANRLSFLFGISTVNFNEPITVFEGPLDSFLFKNGMSICGIDNEFPLDFSVRWMYDFDNPGLKKSLEKLQNKEAVFLWTKYLKDVGFEKKVKKLDFTDLLLYLKENKKEIISFEKYFSSNKYDAYML